MRKPEQILKSFDDGYPKFKWFIKEYLPHLIDYIEIARKEKDTSGLLALLNDVWFSLPDGRFNIIENPPGWSEFLNVIEE